MVHPLTAETSVKDRVIKFTNCFIPQGNTLVKADLWISPETGKILDGQDVFYNSKLPPSRVINLKGKILSPGFIETQINGGFGFDFSATPERAIDYIKGVLKFRKGILQYGVTSFLPTITSQRSELYKTVLPFLKPSGGSRNAADGAEVLGAHCEGPFLNPHRNGIHPQDVLVEPSSGFSSLLDFYGSENLQEGENAGIKLITIAPELPGAIDAINKLKERGIIAAMGHSTSTYEHAMGALSAGASTITHLFNAMEPLHHRNPGIFGTLGVPGNDKPYFGLISDGIHLHPTCINIAWHSHPNGCILVTDAMFAAGLPDGIYDWTNGDKIEKKGQVLLLAGSENKIAGSAATLIECVNHFLNWTGASVAEALRAVTTTPARMLGIQGTKGVLTPGADADLLVLDETIGEDGSRRLKVEQVWKFGEKVYDTEI